MDAELGVSGLEAGVPYLLARHRAAALSDISYSLSLELPEDPSAPVTGIVKVRFTKASDGAVVLDFAGRALKRARIGPQPIAVDLRDEHVVVPGSVLRVGVNEVEFEFEADSAPLNRRRDLVHSLFVPARARLVFPCFDQPDLKARFTLTLALPPEWRAVSNTPIAEDAVRGAQRVVRFRTTERLPTYLFAFVAGALVSSGGVRGRHSIHVWHRDGDARLVRQNVDAIVDLHVRALDWLESYTRIPYPFSQFDIVLVPSFQFSGMEHPGVILYNASRLLLETSSSEHHLLTRAALIAHETAHIWFGDLVTMRWFDEVWLKEVFANFVAEKVVAEARPDANHDLRFFLANYPAAYDVDRSAGANPIRQPLANLNAAGQLYGPIIYLKAPILFRHLEEFIGPHEFREGVRRYLRAHSFGNAGWDDLLAQWHGASAVDLAAWSEAWLEQPGRPTVIVQRHQGVDGRSEIVCRVPDAEGLVRRRPQRLIVAIGYEDRVEHAPIMLDGSPARIAVQGEMPQWVLAGGAGWGYGQFPLDDTSRRWLLDHAAELRDPMTRGVAWMALWEELLTGTLEPASWLHSALPALAAETEEQSIERLLVMLEKVFWLFLSATERMELAEEIESSLALQLRCANSRTARATWFAALRRLTISAPGIAWLERVWRRDEAVPGLDLGEADETALAVELALRQEPRAQELVERQARRVSDDDRRAALLFVSPALSADSTERERAFHELADPAMRVREPWVLTRLHCLNHPTRQAYARQFLRPGLRLLPEIMATGDIFFPARWSDALLGGHSSPAAAAVVREFLDESPALADTLRRTVLVAADMLFRASRAGLQNRPDLDR